MFQTAVLTACHTPCRSGCPSCVRDALYVAAPDRPSPRDRQIAIVTRRRQRPRSELSHVSRTTLWSTSATYFLLLTFDFLLYCPIAPVRRCAGEQRAAIGQLHVRRADRA